MNRFKTGRVDFAFVLLILVSIAAMINIIVLTFQYASGTSEQAVRSAEVYSMDVQEKFSAEMDSVRDRTQAVAMVAGTMTEENALKSFVYDIANSKDYKKDLTALRYFNGDAEYNENGVQVPLDSENVSVLDMRRKNVLATYGLIYDERGNKPSVACYCPINNCPVADGIVLFYAQDSVLSFAGLLDEKRLSYAELVAVCCQNYDGAQILAVFQDKNDAVKTNDSFLTYLSDRSNDNSAETSLRTALETGTNQTVTMTLNNEKYVVTIGRSSSADTGLYAVGVYKESTVYADGFTLVETSIVTMAILFLTVVMFTIYYFISRKHIYAKIDEIDTVNTVLQCPTLLKFQREAKEIMLSNKGTTFAVVVSHVQHFSYVLEKYGDASTNAILRQIRSTFARGLMKGETYGYIDNGEFALLLHYSEEAALENRLMSLLQAAKRRYVGNEIPEDYDLKMLFGIYKAGKGLTAPVEKMVEKAMEVSDMPSRTDINRICNYYDETIRSDYMIKAEIENRMEAALEAGEFRVFYQPKYNLENDRIDGAELLVRWYDPEKKNYRSPAEFLPVFEENGFISKLDRHIYYTACENVAKWIQEGRKIYPISVNISRVTAIQPDFLTFYIRVKKHFNIADGFITLEFTESFAYENYEYLSKVAEQLRKAGFLCSIDDFGTGYSTYNVLKLLRMDEIKLDKFFLDKGVSQEVDDTIIRSIIDVGKKMGLKTTQEGVETLEDLERLRAMGCQVIQGYFFAKPMSSNDYKLFIDAFHKENPILAAEEAARNAK